MNEEDTSIIESSWTATELHNLAITLCGMVAHKDNYTQEILNNAFNRLVSILSDEKLLAFLWARRDLDAIENFKYALLMLWLDGYDHPKLSLDFLLKNLGPHLSNFEKVSYAQKVKEHWKARHG